MGGGVALSVAAFVAPAIAIARPADGLERHEYTKLAMGVEARIVLYAPDEDRAVSAAKQAFQRIDELDAILSHYRENSELNQLVRSAGTPFRASDDLARAVWFAGSGHDLTGGAFDVTVRPYERLWKTASDEGRLPTPDELATARKHVGMHKVLQNGSVIELQVGVELDLGGIGKGFACDEALKTLKEQGCPSGLVEIGGDLAVGDAPPSSEGWTVLVGGNSDRPPRTLVLANKGVASSGDRYQHVEIDGVRYSHVIDPRTGMGTTHGLGFSVVSSSATQADILASAACVLGEEGARAVMAHAPHPEQVIVDDPRQTWLFDGRTLDGWATTGGRYDGNARWTVEDGCLVGRSGENNAGGLIYTKAPYTHFALELDVKITPPFDSGVFLRMLPRSEGDLKGVQITLDDVPGGEIGAVYADGFLQHNKTGTLHWRQGEWNHVEVRCTDFDFRLQAFVNDQKITDYALPEGTPGYASDGLIGLQVHPGEGSSRGEVRFRNVAIRPLPAFPETLDGFEPMFNGTDLTGWTPSGSTEGYRFDDGVLCIPAEGGGYLFSDEDYRDVRLRLDFQIANMANSGVYLRSARTDENPSYSGCEVQILDDFNWETVTESTLVPYQFTGGLYGSIAPAENVLRPIGEWNTYEILYRGSRLAVSLNSKTLYDVDTHALTEGKPFAERVPEGFIGFQRYGAPQTEGDCAVRLRDVRVQRIDPASPTSRQGADER